MRISIPLLSLALLTAALLLGAPKAGFGQNDPAIGSSVDEVRLGEYWYGKKIDKKDLIGKVVLMEIWGS